MRSASSDEGLDICIDCESNNVTSAYIRSPKDDNFTIPIAEYVEPSDLHYVILRCADCGSIFLHPYYFEESFNLYDDTRYFSGYFPNNIHTGGGPQLRPSRFQSYTRWVNKNQARRFLRMASLPENSETRVVDIGCAKGDLALGFADCGCDACGVDISDQMIQEARKKGVSAIQGKFEDVSISESSFDLITSIEVFEHMSDLKEVLAKIKQALKPGGVLIVQVPNDIDGYRRILFRKIWWMIPPMHIRYFTRRSVENIFGRHGFRVIKIRTQGSVGADIGRVLTWVLKNRAMRWITNLTIYKLVIKIISALLFPIDVILNFLKRHSEMILAMRKSEA